MVAALCAEMVLRKDEIPEPIETIYFGGGTPSLLTIEELRLLLETIYSNYKVSENPEITLEANPDDLVSRVSNNVSKSIFEDYKNLGINRLSIGVQSFFEEDLRMMNRVHNAGEAQRAIEEATQFFDNISIDLIYGIPNMSNERWLQNVEKALAFGIPHISSYALTVEPNTALKKFIDTGKIPPVDDALAERHFFSLVETLEKNEFVHYELSNFGKEGFFSKNNTAYWTGKPYLGVGPSAHSFNGKQRSWNVRNNSLYIQNIESGKLPSETETLGTTDVYNEYIMTGLRTMWGVSLEKVEKDFGKIYVDYLLKEAQSFLEQQLLILENRVLKVTKKGRFLSDGISAGLFKVD